MKVKYHLAELFHHFSLSFPEHQSNCGCLSGIKVFSLPDLKAAERRLGRLRPWFQLVSLFSSSLQLRRCEPTTSSKHSTPSQSSVTHRLNVPPRAADPRKPGGGGRLITET